MYRNYIKRLIDFIFAFLLLFLLLPVFLVLAILFFIDNKGKIIYRHQRFGQNNVPFTIYKFWTLDRDTTKSYNNRTTKFGRIMRNIGLDELPQILNIIKGDMSFVGPRPFAVFDELPNYPIPPARSKVKPGVFGYAQGKGRRYITHEQKIDYDVYYANNLSFWLMSNL